MEAGEPSEASEALDPCCGGSSTPLPLPLPWGWYWPSGWSMGWVTTGGPNIDCYAGGCLVLVDRRYCRRWRPYLCVLGR